MNFLQPSKMSRTAVLVECALMVALGFALSFIYLFAMPMGGKVTCFSTLPVIVTSFRHGLKWGVASASIHGLLQAIMGAWVIAAAGSIPAMALCALLDYFAVFAVLGLTGPMAKALSGLHTRRHSWETADRPRSGRDRDGRPEHATLPNNNTLPNTALPERSGLLSPAAGMAAGIIATGMLRLFFSYLSGILLWGSNAPEGMAVWWYSLTYNASWCVPDFAIVLLAAFGLGRVRHLHLFGAD